MNSYILPDLACDPLVTQESRKPKKPPSENIYINIEELCREQCVTPI